MTISMAGLICRITGIGLTCRVLDTGGLRMSERVGLRFRLAAGVGILALDTRGFPPIPGVGSLSLWRMGIHSGHGLGVVPGEFRRLVTRAGYLVRGPGMDWVDATHRSDAHGQCEPLPARPILRDFRDHEVFFATDVSWVQEPSFR